MQTLQDQNSPEGDSSKHYSTPAFLEHFVACPGAQSLWNWSDEGTIDVDWFTAECIDSYHEPLKGLVETFGFRPYGSRPRSLDFMAMRDCDL